jgi:hypothetical protein
MDKSYRRQGVAERERWRNRINAQPSREPAMKNLRVFFPLIPSLLWRSREESTLISGSGGALLNCQVSEGAQR